MLNNAVGRILPEQVGNYKIRPYLGSEHSVSELPPVVTKRTPSLLPASGKKQMETLEQAIKASGLKNGMTISFHHSFREGDMIVGQVLAAISDLGIKDLYSIFDKALEIFTRISVRALNSISAFVKDSGKTAHRNSADTAEMYNFV